MFSKLKINLKRRYRKLSGSPSKIHKYATGKIVKRAYYNNFQMHIYRHLWVL